MKKTGILMLLTVSLAFMQAVAQPVKIILDTDIDSDVDDVGALAMIHTLANYRVVEILGVVVTSDDKFAPQCADAINHYYKRPRIPVGVQKGIELREFSKYTRQISEEFNHSLKRYDDAEDAVLLYRRLLARQPDTSVVIISIGHLTNLRLLLESPPDKYSQLSGIDLVRKKVKLWSCMGGQFPEGKEANFYRPDPASTVYCVNNWPGQAIFAGWEVGNQIITGGAFLSRMLPDKSPVRRAYELYNNFAGRQSWDQVSVLYAIAPDAYWNVKRNGRCEVLPDGSNRWLSDNPNPGQGYLTEKTNPLEVAKIIDSLMTGIYHPGFRK